MNSNQSNTIQYPKAPELMPGGDWLNTSPLNLNELVKDRVVLIDFWTYSCINCIRTLPYLNDWHKKYADQGLVIIGVHTPEFEFEKDSDNVRDALQQYGIDYPVMQDNNYATWSAYGNRYWPRKYLLNNNGEIVYDHIGEGGYAETEAKIQELLAALHQQEMDVPLTSAANEKPRTTTGLPVTPELYLGALRNSHLGNGRAGIAGTQTFAVPENPVLGEVYLGGDWEITDEYSENIIPGAFVVLPYQATSAYMVASASHPVDVEVREAGKLITTITVGEEKLYTIFEREQYESGTLEFVITDPGLQLYTFTFG